MSKSGLPDQRKSSLFVQIENLGVSAAACPVVVKWALDAGFVTCTLGLQRPPIFTFLKLLPRGIADF